MALSYPLARIVLTGTAPSGEEFSCGFFIDPPDGVQSADGANTLAAHIAGSAAFTTLLSSLKSLINADTAYTTLHAYIYDGSPTVAAFVGQAAIANGAGTGTASLPLQTAMVVTLLTEFSGRRYRGRLYLPANGKTLISHQFATADTSGLANAWGTFLTALANDAQAGPPLVVSRVGAIQTGIVSVKVDSRPDTQRRRAEGVTPLYTFSAPVTAA